MATEGKLPAMIAEMAPEKNVLILTGVTMVTPDYSSTSVQKMVFIKPVFYNLF
ncbi:MAG: hypothetical protein WDM90_17810 [Ferruginibacter sp.]